MKRPVLPLALILFCLCASHAIAQMNIVSTSPTAFANFVPTTSNITITFDQVIDGATLTSATVVVRGSFTDVVPGSLSASANTITFIPDNEWKAGEVVNVTVTTGLKSVSAQGLARGNTITFTVRTGTTAVTPPTFAQRHVDFSSGSTPLEDVTPIDFDHDGDMDLVVGVDVPTSEITYVYENDGNGNFCNRKIAEFRKAEVFDIDGDGDLDAFSNSGNDTNLHWWRNDGAASTQVFIATTLVTWTVAGGDVDGDGDVDLIASVFLSSTSNQILLFRNNGAGTFAAPLTISTNNTGGSDSYYNVVDVDGDRDMDIVAYNENSLNLIWYQNNGSLVFTEHIITTTTNTQRTSWADVDSDGDVDILSANTVSTNDLAWWENDGSENFTKRSVAVSTTNRINAVRAVDIDGDLDMDLLSGAYWFENNGSQSFTQRVLSYGALTGPGEYANVINYGDMDLDGDIDVTTAGALGKGFAWHENNKFMNVTSTTPANGAFSVSANGNISVTFNQPIEGATLHAASFIVRSRSRGLVAGTFSGGGTNTVTFDPTNNFVPGEKIEVAINERLISTTGHNLKVNYGFDFTIKPSVAGAPIFTSSTVITHAAGASGFDIGDVDSDGDLDLISCSSTEIFWHRNNGSGGFTSIPITTSVSPRSVFITDFDNDGDTDFIMRSSVANYLYLNDGSQNFTESILLLSTTVLDVADVDRDGDMDVTSNSTQTGWAAFICDRFTMASIPSVAGAILMMRAADMDNDGDIDLMRVATGGGIVYLNDGFLNYTNAAVNAISVNDVAMADLDGDGDLDPIYVRANNSITWSPNNLIATGTWGSNILIGSLPNDPRSVVAADLDGDGDPDIAAVSRTDDQIVWYKNRLNEATTDFAPAAALPAASDGPILIKSADLNGDGTLDLVVISDVDNKLNVYTNIAASLPTISSFTPTSGPIGTTVTINGTNFSSTPANNIVFFGATRATVTGATPTQITVTVPTGATFQPITVNVGGFIASSNKPFLTTFAGGSGINICSFDPKIDLTTPSNVNGSAVGDLDGDGKADVVIMQGNNASVFRNTSSGSGIVSYATRIDHAAGSSAGIVSLADFDGDGKLDMIVTNSGGTSLSVFRNLSSGPGNISFTSKIDFTTGASTIPRYTTIADFDGDARLDFAVTLQTANVVSVFRNTSTGVGNINFAAKVDFALSNTPQQLASADFDLDGKVDIVATNSSPTSTVSVFRNTSTGAGSIAFATKVDFSTAVGPNGVTVGDLDGDGKFDMATSNFFSNTMSVFRNTSSAPGTISFATKQDFTTGTQAHIAAISDLDGDGKADIALENFGSSTVSVFRNTSAAPGSISLGTKVDFTSGLNPRHMSIADIDSDGRPDLVTANQNGTSFSTLLNKVGSGANPTISGFSPTNGPVGTPVTITGTNFNAIPGNNLVQFNGTTAVVTGGTTTSLTANVPAGATTGRITVNSGTGCTAQSASNFTVDAPTITIDEYPSDFEGCENEIAIFTCNASGTTNITYRWQFSAFSPIAFTDIVDGPKYSGATTNTLSVNTAGLFGSGLYRCRVNGDFASEEIAGDAGAYTYPLATPPVTTGAARCDAGTFTLTATGGDDGEFQWYNDAAGLDPVAEYNGTYVTPVLSATTTYYVSVTTINTCESNRVPVTATINTPPAKPVLTSSITATAGVVTLCSGNTVTLSAPAGFQTYSWSSGATTQAITVSGGGSYTVIVTNAAGCASPASDAITVNIITGTCNNQAPVITPSAYVTAPSGQVSIDLTKHIADIDNNLDVLSIKVKTQPISGAKATIVSQQLVVDYSNVAFSGTDRVGIEACDLLGSCAQSDFTIEVAGEITVYNAISPNGDSKNEVFFIQYIDVIPEAKDNKVMIFDRWGSTVFEVDNYDNVTRVFRGQGSNGSDLPAGTYYYQIVFPTGSKRTGFIALRR